MTPDEQFLAEHPLLDERPRLYHLPGWYMGGHGDPVATGPALVLELHSDGRVTWKPAE